jgi:hypothetical protein
MSDELNLNAAAWEELLAKQMEKGKPKPPRNVGSTEARKPGPEKSFTSQHYLALGKSDWDTQYKRRDPDVYVVLHFYLRAGDTFAALQRDARNYAQYFPHSKIIAHDHSWDDPCSTAPNQRKCKEI